MTKEERYKKIVADLEKVGATIESRLVDFDHTKAFWYDGNVVSITYRGYSLRLYAAGYIVLRFGDKSVCKPIGDAELLNNDLAKALVINDDNLDELLKSEEAKLTERNAIYLYYVDKHDMRYSLIKSYQDFIDALEGEVYAWLNKIYELTTRSPEFFASEMKNISQIQDNEKRHIEADRLLIKTLKALGFSKGCEIFELINRWYS